MAGHARTTIEHLAPPKPKQSRRTRRLADPPRGLLLFAAATRSRRPGEQGQRPGEQGQRMGCPDLLRKRQSQRKQRRVGGGALVLRGAGSCVVGALVRSAPAPPPPHSHSPLVRLCAEANAAYAFARRAACAALPTAPWQDFEDTPLWVAVVTMIGYVSARSLPACLGVDSFRHTRAQVARKPPPLRSPAPQPTLHPLSCTATSLPQPRP